MDSPEGTNSSRMEVVPPTLIFLPFWTRFFLNSETGLYPSPQNNTWYKCKLKIRYILNSSECTVWGGELLPCGYWICVGICAIIILLAHFGVFTNILNLLILPKSLKGCSVRRLMVLLTIFDLLASICAIPVSLLLILILGKYEVNMEALEVYRIMHLLFSLGRTGSIFVTITIAIERYIAVAFPLKSWLTPKKSSVVLVSVVIIIAFVNLPWWLNKTLEKNEMYLKTDGDGNYSSELSEFPYIYKSTLFSRTIYPYFVKFHLFIDFALPFPMILLFNGLLYRSIYLSNKARKTLTTSQIREVNAAKMFSVVALILLVCHLVALVAFIVSQYFRITFRELQFFQILGPTLNASVNFVIYYAFGKSFRDEFWNLIHPCKLFRNKVEQAAAVTPSASSSNGTVEMGVSTKTRSVKQQRVSSIT